MTRSQDHEEPQGATRRRATTALSPEPVLAPAPATGLSPAEVARRRAQYGYNELVEKRRSPALVFLSYLWGPIPWMIEVAAVLSLAVQHWADCAIILTLLMVNAVVGFWEEYQAGNTIAALKATLALRARVKREGSWTTVPARELVPGDLIRLRLGDIVPADATLLAGTPLEMDQSALTGESLPVERRAGQGVYSGSIVRQGETDATVSATGPATYMGKTAHLVQAARAPSHFQRAVLRIGNYLIVLAAVLVVLILGVSLLRRDNLLTTLEFALVLTVAAIPVAMPTVLSVTMAVGARVLAHKQAIVSRLAAIEELAGIDVLCSDKTGTLTQNALTLGAPACVAGASADEVRVSAALASRRENQDPIDLAVLGGLGPGPAQAAMQAYQVTHFQPFDPVHKRTEATVRGPDGREVRVTKGAPHVILALAANAAQVQPQVDVAIAAFAARGFRALGVARTDAQGAWQFLGVLPLYDPPRADSRATIAMAQQMGVTVKMITGDQVAIGKEIAHQVGLGTTILDASLFTDAAPNQCTRLASAIEQADGFAQVFPEHKYRIVEALQQRGHLVGMTGDGVNDAPALKKADAGIAVSGATDAARAAAAIVLLTPGLSVIIDAIKESRKIFQRMTNYALYRIAETIRVLLFMSLSILLFNVYPVTAIMIVLLALLNDGAILSIAYDRVRYSDQPEVWDMRRVLTIATVLGVLGVVESFGLFLTGTSVFHLSLPTLRTVLYLKLSVAGHLTVFVARTRGPFWSRPWPARILVGAVVATQLVATGLAIGGLLMTPISLWWALLVWGYALIWFVVEDRVKLLAYRVLERQRPASAAPHERLNKMGKA